MFGIAIIIKLALALGKAALVGAATTAGGTVYKDQIVEPGYQQAAIEKVSAALKKCPDLFKKLPVPQTLAQYISNHTHQLEQHIGLIDQLTDNY